MPDLGLSLVEDFPSGDGCGGMLLGVTTFFSVGELLFCSIEDCFCSSCLSCCFISSQMPIFSLIWSTVNCIPTMDSPSIPLFTHAHVHTHTSYLQGVTLLTDSNSFSATNRLNVSWKSSRGIFPLSLMGRTDMPNSFSKSPCSKNSSARILAHRLADSNGRA